MTKSNILFLCTGNSARSIMAEAIMNRLGAARFRAFSAGSHPKSQVHPEALRLLESEGYDISGLRPKSWDEFSVAGGKSFAHIITVCDNAAGEACPVIPGMPARAHWDIPDPPAAGDVPKAFREAYALLKSHIEDFLARMP
jgi:protein-tyrosine-phosphatase